MEREVNAMSVQAHFSQYYVSNLDGLEGAQTKLSVSGPLTPSLANDILARENAGRFRMAYQTVQ